MSVTCEVCYEPYGSDRLPRVLPACGHDFCTQCLESLAKYDTDPCCPKCRLAIFTKEAPEEDWLGAALSNDGTRLTGGLGTVMQEPRKHQRIGRILKHCPVLRCLADLETRIDFSSKLHRGLVKKALDAVPSEWLETELRTRALTSYLRSLPTEWILQEYERRTGNLPPNEAQGQLIESKQPAFDLPPSARSRPLSAAGVRVNNKAFDTWKSVDSHVAERRTASQIARTLRPLTSSSRGNESHRNARRGAAPLAASAAHTAHSYYCSGHFSVSSLCSAPSTLPSYGAQAVLDASATAAFPPSSGHMVQQCLIGLPVVPGAETPSPGGSNPCKGSSNPSLDQGSRNSPSSSSRSTTPTLTSNVRMSRHRDFTVPINTPFWLPRAESDLQRRSAASDPSWSLRVEDLVSNRPTLVSLPALVTATAEVAQLGGGGLMRGGAVAKSASGLSCRPFPFSSVAAQPPPVGREGVASCPSTAHHNQCGPPHARPLFANHHLVVHPYTPYVPPYGFLLPPFQQSPVVQAAGSSPFVAWSPAVAWAPWSAIPWETSGYATGRCGNRRQGPASALQAEGSTRSCASTHSRRTAPSRSFRRSRARRSRRDAQSQQEQVAQPTSARSNEGSQTRTSEQQHLGREQHVGQERSAQQQQQQHTNWNNAPTTQQQESSPGGRGIDCVYAETDAFFTRCFESFSELRIKSPFLAHVCFVLLFVLRCVAMSFVGVASCLSYISKLWRSLEHDQRMQVVLIAQGIPLLAAASWFAMSCCLAAMSPFQSFYKSAWHKPTRFAEEQASWLP